MKKCEGTLDERKRELNAFIERVEPGGFLEYMVSRFGGDALVAAALDAAKVAGRTKVEKLAEAALDLVPGQIKKVVPTDRRTLLIPRYPPMSYVWNDGAEADMPPAPLDSARIELERWEARVCFAFDSETGVLFVLEDPQ